MSTSDLALVLTGGGARAAYQVGFLRHLASRHPDIAPGILTGVSAGGIIAMHLAGRRGNFAGSVDHLSELWEGLQIAGVFRVDPADLTSLGSRETRSNDMLSLLMFQKDYIARLIELGEADARARADEVDAFVAPE